MKAKNKIITAILLSAGAAVGTALINKYITRSPISRNLLAQRNRAAIVGDLAISTIQKSALVNHFFSYMT